MAETANPDRGPGVAYHSMWTKMDKHFSLKKKDGWEHQQQRRRRIETSYLIAPICPKKGENARCNACQRGKKSPGQRTCYSMGSDKRLQIKPPSIKTWRAKGNPGASKRTHKKTGEARRGKQ